MPKTIQEDVESDNLHQPMGSNTIGAISLAIATFLVTTNPTNKYTGHSYRRTGATILANCDLSLLELRQAGDAQFYCCRRTRVRDRLDAFGDQVATPSMYADPKSCQRSALTTGCVKDGSPVSITNNLAISLHLAIAHLISLFNAPQSHERK